MYIMKNQELSLSPRRKKWKLKTKILLVLVPLTYLLSDEIQRKYKLDKNRHWNKRKCFRGKAKETVENKQEQASNDDVVTEEILQQSALGCKIKLPESSKENSSESETVPKCNIIINTDLQLSLTLMVDRCPDCFAAVNVTHLP